jgi:transposase
MKRSFTIFVFYQVQISTYKFNQSMINTYLVIVDNCPIHRYNGKYVWVICLQQMGVGYIFLPRYSPELNIAENCFLKVKTVLKQERFLNIVRSNLKVAIGQNLQEITMHDLKEFCVATGCLNVHWILCVRTSVRRTIRIKGDDLFTVPAWNYVLFYFCSQLHLDIS